MPIAVVGTDLDANEAVELALDALGCAADRGKASRATEPLLVPPVRIVDPSQQILHVQSTALDDPHATLAALVKLCGDGQPSDSGLELALKALEAASEQRQHQSNSQPADDLDRSRVEIAELNAFIRHIDTSAEKARRERDQAHRELAQHKASIAGRTTTRFHQAIARTLPDNSTGREIYRLAGQAARRVSSFSRKD